MKKIKPICAAAVLLALLAAPASADYLQTADEALMRAADSETASAAEELLDYVYGSGAAKDTRAETRRLYIRNYMLNLRKQPLDYSQFIKTETYENWDKSKPVGESEQISEEAYESARLANEIQAEIRRNEAYLERLTSDEAVTAHARELEDRLTEKEKRPSARAAADAAGFAAAVGLLGVALYFSKRFALKHGYVREDEK